MRLDVRNINSVKRGPGQRHGDRRVRLLESALNVGATRQLPIEPQRGGLNAAKQAASLLRVHPFGGRSGDHRPRYTEQLGDAAVADGKVGDDLLVLGVIESGAGKLPCAHRAIHVLESEYVVGERDLSLEVLDRLAVNADLLADKQ